MSYANCARTPKLTLAPPLPALIWRNLFVRRTHLLLPSCSLFFWTETILEIGSGSSTEDVKTGNLPFAVLKSQGFLMRSIVSIY